MNNRISQPVINNYEDLFTTNSTYLPISIDKLENLSLYQLPVGVEIIPFNHIINNYFTLNGFRISVKKEYGRRVVIGCVEDPEYMVVEDEDLDNTLCKKLVETYLLIINTKHSSLIQIAA